MAIEQLLQPRQSGLPPGTQLGIVANQMAQRGQYKPFTSDGRPTVVKNLIDQESQREAAEQAALAGQIQAQKEQEIRNAMRQMAAQQTERPVMAAKGGIITLPADVNMAEGGIVGYNGEERSDVELPVNERIKKAYRDYLAARERGEPLFRRSGAEALEDLLRGRPAPEAQRLTPEAPVVPEATSAATRQGKSGIAEQDIGEVMRSMAAPRPAPSSRPSAAPPAVSAAPASGVASLMGLPVPAASDVEYGRQRAAIQQMLEDAKKPMEESLQDKALRTAREAEIARQTGAVEAARKRFTESQEKQKSQDLINYLSGIGRSGKGTLFSAMSESGGELSKIQAAREAERIKYMDLLDTRDEAVGKLKLAQLTGDAELAREASKELRKNTLNIQKLGLDLGAERMKELSSAERNERDIAARASEGALNRAAQLQIAKIQAAARNDPQSKEALAMARVQAAINGSPALKELAKAASMGLSGAQERYAAEEARLYQRLAPELMGGAETTPALAPPPAGAVREKSKG